MRIKLPVGSAVITQFPQEANCFTINQLTLSGSDYLTHWLRLQRVADQAKGYCLGGQGINLLMSAIQNRLIDYGYITTRVLAPPQDLNSGKLQLQIL